MFSLFVENETQRSIDETNKTTFDDLEKWEPNMVGKMVYECSCITVYINWFCNNFYN